MEDGGELTISVVTAPITPAQSTEKALLTRLEEEGSSDHTR